MEGRCGVKDDGMGLENLGTYLSLHPLAAPAGGLGLVQQQWEEETSMLDQSFFSFLLFFFCKLEG